nr:hypothetical protein [Chlamydia abortus]
MPRKLSTLKHYAYLKIAEGCRKRCAFCIIPTIKGLEQVIKEFRLLLKMGVKEVILIAQDLGDYGKDLSKDRKSCLHSVLIEMLKAPVNYRIRILYLYPDEVGDTLN